ncbi:uncharacterized protein VTP21DRAFT_321 [Calcarisporiella thermophila]|uniref:uncharacterized protein n=1 Tax=Calcarisporiella thermophila TaxID=911321 RepID=UPI003743C886
MGENTLRSGSGQYNVTIGVQQEAPANSEDITHIGYPPPHKSMRLNRCHAIPLISIAISYISFILIGINDAGLGVLLKNMKQHYLVDDAHIALIFVFNLIGFLISSLSAGFCIQKLGIRWYLVAGHSLFLIATLANGFAPPLVLLLFIMLVLGGSIASIDAGFNAYIIGFKNSTTLLGYLHAFYGIGGWVGPVVTSSLIAQRHLLWNHVYFLWTAMCGVSLILILTLFREHSDLQNVKIKETIGHPPSGEMSVGTQAKRKITLTIFRNKFVWWSCITFLVYMGIGATISNWMFSFFVESRSFTELVAGWMISIYWIGMTAGRIITGHLANRLGRMRSIFIGYALCYAGLAIAWAIRYEVGSGVGMFLVGFGLGPAYPIAISVIISMLPEYLRPGSIGFLTSAACVGNGLLSWLAGYIYQNTGRESLMIYLTVGTGVSLMGFIGLHLYKVRSKSAEHIEQNSTS